jgi:hypothetical protein
MYFSFNDEGRVMISASEPIFPGMVELTPPDGFDNEHQPDWIYSGGAWVHDPLEVPEEEMQPGYGERIANLEKELAAAKILLGVSE